MRVAWATPFHRHSSIGRMGAAVAAALSAQGHDVRIIATDLEDLSEADQQPTRLNVQGWRHVDLDRLHEAVDLVIVNVGDHYVFHAGIFALLDQAAPCLGIFHDAYIFNLFNGWLSALPEVNRGKCRDEIVSRLYGEEALELGLRAHQGHADITEIALKAPMLEWIAERCFGAMSHADFYVPRIRAVCQGPIAIANLPVPSRGIPSLPKPENRGEGPVRLLTVGMMNENKRIDRILEAIAASHWLSGCVTYHLAGLIASGQAERLMRIATESSIKLTILGPVDDAALAQELTEAEVITCLRSPVLEGASGSTIEALLAGRPVVVADVGFYAQLPETVALKIPETLERECLTKQLERLVADPRMRHDMGQRAKLWAEPTFSMQAYMGILEPLMEDTVRCAPILRFKSRLAGAGRALGLKPNDSFQSRVEQLTGEFGLGLQNF